MTTNQELLGELERTLKSYEEAPATTYKQSRDLLLVTAKAVQALLRQVDDDRDV